MFGGIDLNDPENPSINDFSYKLGVNCGQGLCIQDKSSTMFSSRWRAGMGQVNGRILVSGVDNSGNNVWMAGDEDSWRIVDYMSRARDHVASLVVTRQWNHFVEHCV